MKAFLVFGAICYLKGKKRPDGENINESTWRNMISLIEKDKSSFTKENMIAETSENQIEDNSSESISWIRQSISL